MGQRRLVLLVPTDQDMTDPAWMSQYWPNFCYRVETALKRDKLDCEVRVAVRPNAQSKHGKDDSA